MRKFHFENKTIVLLSLVNIFFILYWGMLLFFNRFSQDDYGFMAWVRNIGPLDFVSQVFNTFSGRFVRYFIYWLKYKMLGYIEMPWLYPSFIYLITVISIIYILRHTVKTFECIQVGVLCYNLLIFCNLEFCAFFWTAAVDYYATAALYPIWLYYFCFVCKNKRMALIGIFLCSLLIGGGCEAHSPLFLYVIVTYMIFNFLFHKTIEKDIKRRLLVSFLLILVGFVIVILSPGSAGRVAMYNENPSLVDMFVVSFKNLAILMYLLSFRIPHLLILLTVSYWAGSHRTKHGRLLDKKILYFMLICLLGLMWISTFPAAYGMGYLGFQRIYTPVVSTIIIFVALMGYRLGQYYSFRSYPIISVIPSFLLVLMSISLSFHIVIDGNTAKEYSDSDAERIAECLTEKDKGRTEDLFLEPLASCRTYNVKSVVTNTLFGNPNKPSLYYGNEISDVIIPDTDVGFANMCIMNYYQLPFAIYLIDK